MDLSIIILHYGSPKEVTANLQKLKKAWLPEKTEVLVINNGRRSANAEIPMDPNPDFDLRYFEIPNKGYPQGNNYGFKQAKGKYLCILNPDIEVEEDTFRVLMDYMKKNSKVGIAGPRLVYPDGVVQDNYRVFPRPVDLVIKRTFLRKIFKWRMKKYLMWEKDTDKSEAVDWLTGAFQMFTRKSWEDIGPNNELYFLFMSDVDICREAWNRGYEVHFVGETQALHNDERLSAGGIKDLFESKIMRIHVWDAVKYYWRYRNKKLPQSAPSCRKD